MKFLQQTVLILAAILCANAFAKPVHHAHGKAKPAAAKQEQPASAEKSDTAPSAATPTPAPAVPHAVLGKEPVPPPPNLDAKSWLLMDYTTGQVLAENNADARVELASITKVLTAYKVSGGKWVPEKTGEG